jgi:hypothetical protein
MAYLENNSTETLLLANQQFLGATVQIPADFIAAQVSFNTAGSGGTLEFLHSYNGINFQNYGDIFILNAGQHSKQVSLKAQFFRVKYINGGANQTNFHLHTRIGKGGAFDDMNVITSGGSGGGGIVQIQDSNGNPLLGTDSALNVNIVGGSGGGIIEGADLDGGAGIEITADSIATGGAESKIINRLYTHSSLYGNSVDGFGVKSDVALSCSSTGILNVSVVGANAFDGVIKGISTGAGATAVSFSADSFTPAGGTAINKLYTRSSLYGADEMGEEHEVRVNLDGQVSVLVENPNPLQTEVTNDVIVSPIVQSQSFNLSQNTGLYADSTGDLDPPFQKSPRGLQGWYYINGNATKASNVYYYFNIPALPLSRQNDILLTDINFVYAVITLDYIGTNYVNLPFLVMGSQALGNETDIIPNFANTRYAYTLPTGNTYITGEPILIYWSDSADKKPLDTFMPNLRRIKLNNPIITGTGQSTKIAYFSINTGTEVVEKQEYTLMGAGYKFNNTGGEQGGIINSSTFDFLFTAQTLIENNLSKLTFTELNELTVSSTGGGGGGGLVQIQAFDFDAPLNAVNLQATANRLLVDSNIVDANTPARKLVINGDGSINVVGATGGSIEGTYNNIHSGSLTASTFSTPLSINNLYGNESVISYEDTAVAITSFISIYGSFDNISYFYIGVLQPAIIRAGLRQASSVLKLKGLKWIKIYNESTTTTATAVSSTLFSG